MKGDAVPWVAALLKEPSSYRRGRTIRGVWPRLGYLGEKPRVPCESGVRLEDAGAGSTHTKIIGGENIPQDNHQQLSVVAVGSRRSNVVDGIHSLLTE